MFTGLHSSFDNFRHSILFIDPTSNPVQRILAGAITSAHEASKAFLASWQKNINGAGDGDVSIRKIAMQTLSEDLHKLFHHGRDMCDPHQASVSYLEDVMALLMEDLAKVFFRGLSDSTEACR